VRSRDPLGRQYLSAPSQLFAFAVNKVNRLSRVFCFRVFSFKISQLSCLLTFVSALSSQVLGQVESSAVPVAEYAISVRQMQVPAKVRADLMKASHDFGRLDLLGARKEIERALQAGPECAQAFTMRALIELASGDVEGAFSDSVHATTLDANDANAFLTLATAENFRRNFEQAAADAEHALRIQPELWQARLEVAKALYRAGQWAAALQSMDPLKIDFPDVHLLRGNVLMRLGRSEEAGLEFATFLKEAPHDARGEQVRKILLTVGSPPTTP
jgi:tetratricopeptide (TPR) repeat protein